MKKNNFRNKKIYINELKSIKKLNKPHKKEKIEFSFRDNEIIKLENVNKYLTNGTNYEHVLKNVSLTIYKGEFVVITGPSGSGKTTLLTILSALERPSSGKSLMFGENTITLSSRQLTKLRANHIGYVFQQYGLLHNLSVKDNILLAANLKKDNKEKKDVVELLKSVDLLELKDKEASLLSGGQQQRVAICRALVKNPDILFGDEPTGAVHINATAKIMKIFEDINQKEKTTVIIVTHDEKIANMADRIIRIENGKIKENILNKNKKQVSEIK